MAIAEMTSNNTAKTSATDQKLELEPSPRWVRAQFNGEYIADSKRVLLAREKGRLPLYYFLKEDVRVDWLEKGRRSDAGDRKQYWNLKVGERIVESAAWSYPNPTPERTALKDYIALKWNQMDHWFEEEEEVFVHPRDPYKRVDVMPSSRHIRVEIEGVIVAETRRPYLLFETGLPTRYYIPPEDVRMELLEPSPAHTECPYKGSAVYWNVHIGDKIHRNIVWGYPDPIPEAPKIKGLLSFYNEKLDIYVDDVLEEKPESPWS
jgi:uncharacterized protein (DUF427 family)